MTHPCSLPLLRGGVLGGPLLGSTGALPGGDTRSELYVVLVLRPMPKRLAFHFVLGRCKVWLKVWAVQDLFSFRQNASWTEPVEKIPRRKKHEKCAAELARRVKIQLPICIPCTYPGLGLGVCLGVCLGDCFTSGMLRLASFTAFRMDDLKIHAYLQEIKPLAHS